MGEKEKGNDELLAEVAPNQEVLEPVIEDDALRAHEEYRTSIQPTDSEEG